MRLSFLISEALRGEGAVLVDAQGESPVDHLDGKDLASRDQVSRALFKAMQKQKVDHIGLDLKSIDVEEIEGRFPSIFPKVQRAWFRTFKRTNSSSSICPLLDGWCRNELEGTN